MGAGSGSPEGRHLQIGGLGVQYLVRGEGTGGRFALVEHSMEPRALAAPVHTHELEDEFSYVLEGRVGVLIGDEEHQLQRGDFVAKPKGIQHTFWNDGDEPARVLEIISPSGFESYFEQIAPLLPPNSPEPRFNELAAVAASYSLQLDLDSIPGLLAKHDLRL